MKLMSTKKGIVLFTAIVLAIFFSKTVFAVWNGTFYDPGDTLNPECSPTDTDCDVRSPLTSVNISDTAYDATTWNGVTTIAPSKNAIRDQIEILVASNHNPITLGTANGLSLATQVLSLALASTSTTGALSDTDWDTFNNKAPALGADDNYVTDAQLVVIGNTSGTNTGDQVVPSNDLGAANNFLTAYNSTTGAFSKAQPTWANIDKTTSSIADITTRSHTALTDIGTNTHAQIDTFIGTTVPTTYLPLAGGTMTGNLLFTDNTLDIGASGTTRPRTGYFGTSLVAPTINATTALQINSTTVLSGSTLGSTITASSLTSIGTLSSGAVPASLVTAGTFGTGAYVMDTSLTVPTVLGDIATTSDLNLKTTSGVGETGADMHFLVGNNGATEAMTILNSGNVGIGTTAPAAALDVYSNSLSLQLHRTGYSQTLDFYPAYSSLPTIIGAGGNGIKISGSLADNNGIYILASGNVGIGTAGPTKLLDVRGDAVLYSTNGSYAEGQSISYTGTATTGGGLNLHAGAAGPATGSGPPQ